MALANGSTYPKAWPARQSKLARESSLLLEQVVGLGADPMTMIGAGARLGLPVVVSIPQLVGGGAVGLAIGDAISTTRRAKDGGGSAGVAPM